MGNGQYGSSNFVFNILNNGFTGNTFYQGRTGTFKRVLNPKNLLETRSKYYVRRNKIIANENDIDVSKVGFELNPFGNEKQLELSSLTPNNITRVSQKTSSLTYDFTTKKWSNYDTQSVKNQPCLLNAIQNALPNGLKTPERTDTDFGYIPGQDDVSRA